MEKSIDFIELKKNSNKENVDFSYCYNLAILGDSATQNLATAIRGYAYGEKISLRVFDVDFNQIDAQLRDNQSEVYRFNPNAILLYLCSENLYQNFCKTSINTRKDFANEYIEKISNYWDIIANKGIKILQYNFVDFDDATFGNYSTKLEDSFGFQLQKLNYLLSEKANANKSVYIVDLKSIQSHYGRNNFFDDKLFYIAKMPISIKLLPEVARQTIIQIKSIIGLIKKCIVLDLDNTLWGGVIGDDGIENIQIGELGIGQAYKDFQQWLKELKNRGIILAVCSKNEEEVAKSPFINHPDMLLKLDDFAVFIANWEDKASNIKRIQKILNIGMDSMVFIDDNSFERNQVKSTIPIICVPELPEDPALYLKTLRGLNLFDTISYSEEDGKRTLQYKEEAKRSESLAKFSNYEEYLIDLDMIATVDKFNKFQVPRIAQLTQRSNQFNLRTVRYSESEIFDLMNNDSYITQYYTLKDKIGDYGLVSVVILEKQNKDRLFIKELLMSCRVLKRGMEEFIMNSIVNTAKKTGFSIISAEYVPTSKNAMVKDFYKAFGYKEIEPNNYEIEVNAYLNKKTNIKDEKDE